MNSTVLFINRISRWFRRFRHRCGYGIHSPFAFNLVTGVIYESGHYYAYDELLLKGANSLSPLRLKDNRLLFRLVNHHEPATGWIIGSDLGITTEYLRAARQSCLWKVGSSISSFLHDPNTSPDLIYIHSTSDWKSFLSATLDHCGDRTLIIFQGIHTSPLHEQQWKSFITNQQVRVTFDLYDFGLAYFEKRLNKEDYIINYF